jgi:hypothetical protein
MLETNPETSRAQASRWMVFGARWARHPYLRPEMISAFTPREWRFSAIRAFERLVSPTVQVMNWACLSN